MHSKTNLHTVIACTISDLYHVYYTKLSYLFAHMQYIPPLNVIHNCIYPTLIYDLMYGEKRITNRVCVYGYMCALFNMRALALIQSIT